MSEFHDIPVVYSPEKPAVIGKASFVSGVITIYLDENHFADLCKEMLEHNLLQGFTIGAVLSPANPSFKYEI